MAVLQKGEEEIEVEDGSDIIEAATQLGIPFGCKSGVCGACEIIVEEGEKNLSEMSEQEKEMKLEEGHRLACQCRIMKGTVKIRSVID